MDGYGRVASLFFPKEHNHQKKLDLGDLGPEILVGTKEQLKRPCCSAAMPQLFLQFFLLSTAAMTSRS
jgi:hypothetical protein